MNHFVPGDFNPQEIIDGVGFTLKKLSLSDLDLNFEAVMSSINIIHQLRGGSWPENNLTKEEDMIDLCWHQREFENRLSFAYTVLNFKKTKCIGCVYIYPPYYPWLIVPDAAEAVINMWVTQEAYDQGLYPKLFKFVKEWISRDWPFKNVYYSNKEIPQIS